MTSDRGTQFMSQLWANISELLGVKLSTMTAYHPQSNGIVERLHRRMKEALKVRLTGPDLADQLPWVLLGMRTEVKQDLNSSTAELVYGAPIVIPGELVTSAESDVKVSDRLKELREVVGKMRPTPTMFHGEHDVVMPKSIMDAKFVFV